MLKLKSTIFAVAFAIGLSPVLAADTPPVTTFGNAWIAGEGEFLAFQIWSEEKTLSLTQGPASEQRVAACRRGALAQMLAAAPPEAVGRRPLAARLFTDFAAMKALAGRETVGYVWFQACAATEDDLKGLFCLGKTTTSGRPEGILFTGCAYGEGTLRAFSD